MSIFSVNIKAVNPSDESRISLPVEALVDDIAHKFVAQVTIAG